MTPEEFKQRMQRIVTDGGYYHRGVYHQDTESIHYNMDKLMCKLLRELGYGDGIDIFEKTERWYS